jgi:hypothetical protein
VVGNCSSTSARPRTPARSRTASPNRPASSRARNFRSAPACGGSTPVGRINRRRAGHITPRATATSSR